MSGIVVILGLGAFGGLLNHLYFHSNILLLPGLERQEEGKVYLKLGFLAEMILGMGAALVAAYLLVDAGDTFRQASTALLGGFGGGGLLAQSAANLERQRARAFQEISEKLVSSPIKSHKITASSAKLEKILKQLEKAGSRQQISFIRKEALSLLQDLFSS